MIADEGVAAVAILSSRVSDFERLDARLSPTNRNESATALANLERRLERVDDLAFGGKTSIHYCAG